MQKVLDVKKSVTCPYPAQYGLVLYNIVKEQKPEVIVEFGTSWGYTAICMGLALKDIGRGKIYTYDIHEKSKYERLTDNISKFGLRNIISPYQSDALKWFDTPFYFDLMYIDLHNNGDVLNNIVDHSFVQKQRKHGAKILFEGGSKLRDDICRQRNVKPISKLNYDYSILFGNDQRHSFSIVGKKR